MKTYREQYDELRFSPQEKQEMVESLLAAVPETRRRVSHKKRIHVLIAAIIAAALCAACASGALQAAIQSLSFFLGNQPEQTQVLGEMAQPIGASVTDNGVTLTVDAVLGDANSYAILYTLSRDDGGPLAPNIDPDKNLRNIHFERCSVIRNDALGGETDYGGEPSFTPFHQTDNSIQFITITTSPDIDQVTGTVTASFHSFRVGIVSMAIEPEEVVVEGDWEVTFPLSYQDSFVDLISTEQTFHAGPEGALTGTLKTLRLSPLSIRLIFTYTIDEEKLLTAYDPTQDARPKDRWLLTTKENLAWDPTVCLNFRDGSVKRLDFWGNGDLSGPQTRNITFEELIPLNTLESVSIGDLTVEVPEQ